MKIYRLTTFWAVLCLGGAILTATTTASAKPKSKTQPLDHTCRIEGEAPGAEGRKVVWSKSKDMFSEKMVEIGSALVGPDGKFVLSTNDIAEPTPTYIVIDYYSTEIFAEPRKVYHMNLSPGFDYHADEKMNAFIESNQLPHLRYTLTTETGETDTTDLNYHLFHYLSTYRSMLSDHFENIRTGRDTSSVGTFMRVSERDFGQIEHPYFQQHRMYSEAMLEFFSGKKSRKELFDAYIDGKSFNPARTAQFDFYLNYFERYFATSRFLPFNQTKRIVEGRGMSAGQKVRVLFDSMGLDYALRNEKLREWVMINGLQQLWNDERINPLSVTGMIRFLSDSSKFPDHRRSARFLLEEAREIYYRSYFTEIKLRGLEGEEFYIDSLLYERGFHYFVFVRADYSLCPSCAQELDRLRKIWTAAGEDVRAAVHIYLINCDYSHARYVHDARRGAYPWPYYHFNGNIDWIRKIDAGRFPAFFLVDDKGRVLDSQVSAPSENLDVLLQKMAKAKR